MTDNRIIQNIINNDNVATTFANLYARWLDEYMYEDINEYGKVLHKSIQKNFPINDIKYISPTKRPFGVKVNVDGTKYHIFAKPKRNYIVISAKII